VTASGVTSHRIDRRLPERSKAWGMPWLGMGGGGGSCVPLAILPSTGQAGRAG
jgi:hypothetical protein